MSERAVSEGAEIGRGEVWWTDLPDPAGSAPGYRRPVFILQSDSFNRSRISTVVVAVITKNTALGEAPGNVSLTRGQSGLPVDSVVNVSQIITIDKGMLMEFVARVSAKKLRQVEDGIRLVLEL